MKRIRGGSVFSNRLWPGARRRVGLWAALLAAGLLVPLVRGAFWTEFETREAPWPERANGFTTVPLPPATNAGPKSILAEPWPATRHLSHSGVPFDLPAGPEQTAATRLTNEEPAAVSLPASKAREIYFLLAADFPDKEPFADGGARLAPLKTLCEPERLSLELIYDDGSSEHQLPLNVRKPVFGVEHGLGLYVVHPTPGKVPVTLLLHDRMHNAVFGILAVTLNSKTPKVQEPALTQVWYPPVKKAALSDLKIAFQTKPGLTWGKITSRMLGGVINLANAPVFTMQLPAGAPGRGAKAGAALDLPSSAWQVESVKASGKMLEVVAVWRANNASLRARLTAEQLQPHETKLSLEVLNTGAEPFTGTLFFPQMSGLKIGAVDETWYFASRLGGVINRVPCHFRDRLGELHPMQVDGFFNPRLGAGLCFMPRDLEDVYRWYHLGKDEVGGRYALEFAPRTVPPGGRWEAVPVVVAAIPGDWKDQWRAYLDWVRTWYRPAVPRQAWFQQVFAFACCHPIGQPDFLPEARAARNELGACDYAHLFGWALTKEYGHWGDYNHFAQFGQDDADGKTRFRQVIQQAQAAGIPVGLYLDGYLVSPNALAPPRLRRETWAIRGEDGRPKDYYDGCYSMCPYVPGWRDYLTGVYQRIAAELKPNGLYVDEFGRNLPERTCFSPDHGHPVPMGMSPGERLLTRQIRSALPTNLVLYSEFVPSDVAGQFQDGAFSYLYPTAYLGHELWWQNKVNPDASHERLAPHYVNLHRFAFPDFKTFHILYAAPHTNGNWFLLKYPFFNGEGLYLKSESRYACDAPAKAFYQKIFRLQHAHKDAFTSLEAEPLVRTEAPNLFANRFATPRKTVWTLLNAGPRTLRGPLLTVPHSAGATYFDAWNNRPVTAKVQGAQARVELEIGPRSVGCLVQTAP